MRPLIRKQAPYVRGGVERTEGSGSGACGVACVVTSLVLDDPGYQTAVGACVSWCVGVGVVLRV